MSTYGENEPIESTEQSGKIINNLEKLNAILQECAAIAVQINGDFPSKTGSKELDSSSLLDSVYNRATTAVGQAAILQKMLLRIKSRL